MTTRVDLEVSVSRAGIDQRTTMANLLQLYLHDFSAFARPDSPHADVDRNGLFAYAGLESYWNLPKREPLLISANNHLAGFALINDWSPSGAAVDFAIAEFFVARKYRRHGVGTQAVHRIMRERPGIWEVAITDYNAPAQAFWRQCLSTIDCQQRSERAGDGSRWSGPIHRLSIS